MPLLIHAVSWWIAGLLVSAWWHTPVPALLLAGAGLVLIRARRVEALLLPAALLVAHAGARETQRCRALLERTLRGGGEVFVALETMQDAAGRRPARGRGYATEARARARCHEPVSVEFAANAPAGEAGQLVLPVPGDRVAVAALVIRTATGLRLTGARMRGDRYGRSLLVSWRATLGQHIDRAFRGRAPLVRALLIADQQGIAAEVRDRYADAGLVHLLSVSGMHVAIIAGALLTLGGAARLPPAWIEPLAMAVVTGYVLLLGCPAPAVRSGVMLLVLSLSARLQRPVHEWTALALGAVLPTVNPGIVHDLGWQLSVGGMAALVGARALKRAWTREARSYGATRELLWFRRWWQWALSRTGVSGWLIGEVFTGVIAVVVTAPIIAWVFGRVSLVAPLSNLLAGPIIALLQPALFLALIWTLLVPVTLGTWLPDATQPLMALLDRVADGAAAVPGAVWPVSPTLGTALGLGIVSALVVRGTAARRGRNWYAAALLVAVITVWVPLLARGNGVLELHVLDVGQGDALALRTPRGRWLLVDAGRRWSGGDAGRRTIVPYVRRLGGDIALFVLSHPHDDHAGGAATVVRALAPAVWWEPAFVSTSPGYREALAALRDRRTRWERVRPGRRLDIDGVAVTVLAPDSAWTAAQHDANETSVVLQVRYGAHRFLLTGDAERDEEAWLLQHYDRETLAADVLKLGHHGSRTSSSAALLDAVQPRLAIASVGTGNRYGHPAPETLAALLAREVPVLRTDLEGTVVVRSDGRELSVHAGADRWILPRDRRVW